MRLFLAATSLSPQYGGPAVSVSGLATALASVNIEVGLWAADQSATTTPLMSGASGVRRLEGTVQEAFETFCGADILHDNGMWLPHNHQLAKLAARHRIPRLVSLRGMLQPWAFAHKSWKKQLAWALYQRRDLKRAQFLHATAKDEAVQTSRFRLGVPVRVVANGIDVKELHPSAASATAHRADKSDQSIALFLGRIHPVKGLPMLIEAWSRLRPKGWLLQIAGPDESGHRAEIEHMVHAAGLDGAVVFLGPIDLEKKRSIYEMADLFVLPSYSENFGMTVAEALAHSVPVLTTTRAPWPQLPEQGCGWWVDPTVEGLGEGLREATSRDPLTLRRMGASGRKLISREFGWDGVAKQFMVIYEEMLGR